MMDRLRQLGGGNAARKRILREAIGYDPVERVVPRGVTATGAQVARGQMQGGGQTQQPTQPQQDQSGVDPAAIRQKVESGAGPEDFTSEELEWLRQARAGAQNQQSQ
jgi:hypothetical protein